MKELVCLSWLLIGHFIGDFAFQSDWMAREKGKSWEVNLYHVLVYTATILLVTGVMGISLSFGAAAIIAISHFFIDPLKARWGIIKHVWFDQLLHVLVLIIAAIIR